MIVGDDAAFSPSLNGDGTYAAEGTRNNSRRVHQGDDEGSSISGVLKVRSALPRAVEPPDTR